MDSKTALEVRTDPKTVLEFAAKNNAKILDLRFTDLPGLWHHVSFPIAQLSEKSFEDGFGIDGSSIRGWAAIHESDMLLVPDPKTHFMDPFRDTPTLVMSSSVVASGLDRIPTFNSGPWTFNTAVEW